MVVLTRLARRPFRPVRERWRGLYRRLLKGHTKRLAITNGGAPRLALVARDGAEVPRASAAWVVVGSEAHGLEESTIQACEQAVTLPMPGGVESLNAAVAGAIAAYLVVAG